MTIVIMLFVLPLGILFYFFDKRTRAQNQRLFESFEDEVKQTQTGSKAKLERIDAMYYANGYRRVLLDDTRLIVEKKYFNLGVLLILFGITSYFGIVFYLIYYNYIQKPDQRVVEL